MTDLNTRITRLQRRLQSISIIAEYLKKIDQRFFWYRLAAFLGAGDSDTFSLLRRSMDLGFGGDVCCLSGGGTFSPPAG